MFDIIDYISNYFSPTDVKLYEYGEKFSIKFKMTQLPHIVDMLGLYDKVSDRDALNIKFSDGGVDISISSDKKYDEDAYKEMVAEYQSGTDINFDIEIKKKIAENKMTIYNWDQFSSDLMSVDDGKFLQTIDFYLKDRNYICFEVYDKKICWNTSTMFFCNSSSYVVEDTINRERIITNSKDVCNFDCSLNIALIPDDFIIKINFENNPFTERFMKMSTLFSLIFISNTASIESDTLFLNIIGQRTNNYDFKLETIKCNKTLNNIYSWIYSEDNIIDKMLIARNLITLHCKMTSLLEIDDKTYSSIISNYQVYLKDNVNRFLDAKERVTDFINEIGLQVKDDSLKLFKNFKGNIFAVFSFLFTIVAANFVSNESLNNIFTYDIIILLDILLIGSIIYYLISATELMFKLNKNHEAYLNLKNNYIDIFSEKEFENIFKDNMYKRVEKTIVSSFVFSSLLWNGCIYALIFLFNYIII